MKKNVLLGAVFIVAIAVSLSFSQSQAAEKLATIPPTLKNPDTYVFATYGDPDTLDPSWTYETVGAAVESNIYEGLIWYNKDKTDEFVPLLSTGWTVNPAGDVWTFDIRAGVTFHEGGSLEAHDVAYSLQRALLQDRTSGPHWMTHEVFFGTYSMQETLNQANATSGLTVGSANPTQLETACNYVKASIVANDVAGTVTYTLTNPAPWFLVMLNNIFIGAVYDQEWMAANGDWDGDCTTWQNYYDPAPDGTILYNQANGTGPYKLDHWTPGVEIVLVANDSYWRSDADPIWAGGPSGVASIGTVQRLIVNDFATRLSMFETGNADAISASASEYSQLEPNYGSVYCFDPSNPVTCPAEQTDGWMQVYAGYQNPAMTPAQFNEAINTVSNPHIGTGALDGAGIPSDFFNDVHIRRAFSWCMDYDALIDQALDNQAAQAQGPIIADMMGYLSADPVYSFNLTNCAAEFQLSSSGVWTTGFSMQIAYNTGNDVRRLTAEILKSGIEAVNPNFHIAVVEMSWPDLLSDRQNGKLPIYVGGWLEDFHDPHNWVFPFLHSAGTYSHVHNMQEPLQSEFDALIDSAASSSDPAVRRPIYEAIQQKAQDDAPMIWLYQPVGRTHLSPYIHGWYHNAAYTSQEMSYVYALEKYSLSPYIFSADFEPGDLSQWSSYNTGGGFLYACAQAAMNGAYGACVERGSNDNRKQLIDQTPVEETAFSARFNFDVNSLSMGLGEPVRIMQMKMAAERPVFLTLQRFAGGYAIQLNAKEDDLSKTKTAWITLSNAPHTIEVDWAAASTPTANDGYAELYIDGGLAEALNGLDNNSFTILSYRMGFTSRLAGKTISGIFYIDDVATSNTGYIGLP